MPLCGIAGKKSLAAKNVLDHTVHSSREDSQNRLWFWGLVFFNPLHTPTRVVCKQVSQLDCVGILLSMEGDCPQNPPPGRADASLPQKEALPRCYFRARTLGRRTHPRHGFRPVLEANQ